MRHHRWLALLIGLSAGAAWGADDPAPRPAGDGDPAGVRCDDAGCTLGPCLARDLDSGTTPAWARSVRLVPTIVGGEPHGFKVYAIRPGSIAAQVGLQNGDRVMDLNGKDLTTPDQMLAIAEELRHASRIDVGLERGGQRVVLAVRLDRRPIRAGRCPPPEAPPAPPPAAVPPEQALRDLARDITCARQRCTLRNGVVDRVLANTALLTSSARLVPVMKDGQVEGIKLYGIGPGSLLHLIGLRSKDVLRRVGGFDVASPEKALAAYVALRDASDIGVDIERAGRRLHLTYHIEK